MEETEVPGENHRPVANHRQTLSHNVASNMPHHEQSSNSQLEWFQPTKLFQRRLLRNINEDEHEWQINSSQISATEYNCT